MNNEGILLVNKSKGKTSFSIVADLRRVTQIKKIGHCGTLDPFASGVMVMLIGKNYTKKADSFISHDKEYIGEITLGKTTPTFDSESEITEVSSREPTLEELESALSFFQGDILQIPPMYSAKKIKGQKLYNLARKGITVDRPPVKINVETTLLDYTYPIVKLRVVSSKGTYIRSIANDLGEKLETGAYLSNLVRTRSGPYKLEDCVDQEDLKKENFDISPFINKICQC